MRCIGGFAPKQCSFINNSFRHVCLNDDRLRLRLRRPQWR
jgi:hypothetical protein